MSSSFSENLNLLFLKSVYYAQKMIYMVFIVKSSTLKALKI